MMPLRLPGNASRIEPSSIITHCGLQRLGGPRCVSCHQELKIATLVRAGGSASNAETDSNETALPAASPRWHVWLIVALVAVNLFVALTPRFFPYGDTPNHLARYTLISAAWHDTAPAWVHFRWLPTGYIAVDVLGAALVTAISPLTALRVLVGTYVVLLPLGTFALIRAVNPRAVGWTLVACLVTFNWYFLAGFLSYCIGTALALLWLAWWWPRRKQKETAVRLLGAVGIAGLYLVHMAAAVTALIPVGVACVEPLLTRSSRAHRFLGRRTARRLATAVTYSAPVVALDLYMKWSSALPQANNAIEFRPALDKFSHLFAPFLSFSRIDGVIVIIAYATALMLCWSSRTHRRMVSLWPLASAAMLICYFVSPVYLFAAWDVDVRFLLPALLIAFVVPKSDQPRPSSHLAVGLLFSIGLLHAVALRLSARQIDSRVTRFLAVMRSVPSGANTLVLVSHEGEDFRVDPFLHAAEWITIEDPSSRVSGLFSGGPNGAYLGHFIACPQLYDVGVEWGQDGFPALDWAQIQRDYGYVALAGANPKATQRILAGATPVIVTPSAAVYRVTRTANNPGRAWPVDSVSEKMCKS